MHTVLQQSMPSILFCIQGMWSHFADDNEHYPKFPNGVQLFSTKFKSYLDFYLTCLNLAPSRPPHLAPFNLCFHFNHFVRHENSFLQAHIYLTSWILFCTKLISLLRQLIFRNQCLRRNMTAAKPTLLSRAQRFFVT